MSKAIDLTNRRYDMLVAKRQVHRDNDKHHAYWECECDCGNIVIVRKDSLESGHAKSCGCMEKKYKKHGYSYTKLYGIFQNMKDRCYNPNNQAYPSYGGRGITICPEWLQDGGVENFIKWSYENGYVDGKSRAQQSIDRKDNDKGYSPDNCRWVNKDIQNYNKRCTRKIVIDGEEKTILDLHNEYGISITALRGRYQRYTKGKITIEELISKEKLINRPQQILITVDGVTQNLTEWEKETGISRKTIANRYRKGARSYEDLFKKGW